MPQITVYPTGDGLSLKTHLLYGATSFWDAANDPVGSADEDITRFYTANEDGDQWQQLTFGNPYVPINATVNSVTVYFRSKLISGSGNMAGRIYVNNTGYNGSLQAMSTTYADYSSTWTVNPVTGVAFTPAELNGTGTYNLTQFGVFEADQATLTYRRTTQCYMVIDYTEAAAGFAVCGGCGNVGVAGAFAG